MDLPLGCTPRENSYYGWKKIAQFGRFLACLSQYGAMKHHETHSVVGPIPAESSSFFIRVCSRSNFHQKRCACPRNGALDRSQATICPQKDTIVVSLYIVLVVKYCKSSYVIVCYHIQSLYTSSCCFHGYMYLYELYIYIYICMYKHI